MLATNVLLAKLMSIKKLLNYTRHEDFFSTHINISAISTFESCVSTKSAAAPVSCGYGREVLCVGIISTESTVRLEKKKCTKTEGLETYTRDFQFFFSKTTTKHIMVQCRV